MEDFTIIQIQVSILLWVSGCILGYIIGKSNNG